MEKTIRYFLLIMIITGTIFTYGCFHDDLFKSDVEEVTEDEVEADEGIEVEVTEEAAAEEIVAPAVDSAPVPASAPAVKEAPVVEPMAPAPAPEVEMEAPAEEPAPAVEETQSIYQDGAFNAQGNYFNPNGAASISVSLTLDNDVVTSLTVTPHATDETSIKFQNAVRDGSSGLVVGKKLDEIGAFSKISTSSLTPNGFNQAIAGIKASAKN